MRAKSNDRDDEYIPLLARALYQGAYVQSVKGRLYDAKLSFARAHELRKRIAPDDDRFYRELEEADYDSEVVMWAK